MAPSERPLGQREILDDVTFAGIGLHATVGAHIGERTGISESPDRASSSVWASKTAAPSQRLSSQMNSSPATLCQSRTLPAKLSRNTLTSRDVPWGEYLLKYHAEEQKESSSSGQHGKTVKVTDIPVKYDIRDINGISYASIDRNQHSPVFCESSWAQAATSALNDRFTLLKGLTYPQVVLAVQVHLVSHIFSRLSASASRFC